MLSSLTSLTRKPSTGSSCRLLYSRASARSALLVGCAMFHYASWIIALIVSCLPLRAGENVPIPPCQVATDATARTPLTLYLASSRIGSIAQSGCFFPANCRFCNATLRTRFTFVRRTVVYARSSREQRICVRYVRRRESCAREKCPSSQQCNTIPDDERTRTSPPRT